MAVSGFEYIAGPKAAVEALYSQIPGAQQGNNDLYYFQTYRQCNYSPMNESEAVLMFLLDSLC